ncbi:MAG: Hsp20/alpha crystallin family protein [Rikenellaceae bacterium]|nr:Hsp20/alpha crystallin family protein [Rikenellaceae bacterium]
MMPVKRNNWLPGIFNDFFGNEWLERQSNASPAVNIMENDSEYKVEVAAPGLTREDFKIQLEDDNHLVISMEKRSEKSYGDPQAAMNENTGSSALEQGEQSGQQPQTGENAEPSQQQGQQIQKWSGSQLQQSADRYLRREFSYSSFRQSMILPDNVNVEKIEASVNDGILTIVIPKTTEEEKAQKAKTIEVK